MDTRPVDVALLTQVLERLREENLVVAEQLLVSTHERIHALETVLLISLRVIERHLPEPGLMQEVLKEVELMQAEHLAAPGAHQALGQCIEQLKLFSQLRLEPLPPRPPALRE
ncbi:MAG: hypothetical protein Q8R98_23725 [Rubrivivax sp.]|nr:hypothetical protein [Rubrivivax sp.]